MQPTTLARAASILTVLIATACGKAPNDRAPETGASQQQQQQQPAAPALADRDWALVTLDDSAAPLGAGGKPATIRFDTTTSRAGGFAGCNQYSATYTMAGDSIHFGPAISTKMACADGDALERAFLGIIPDVTTYRATDSTLTLGGASGPLAHFRAQ